MAKGGGRRVFLGVQWDSASWDNLPPLGDLLIEKAGKTPILWSIPAVPSDSLRKARAWLEKKISPRIGLDTVASAGFAGACHPVLSLDELARELTWGVENPWGTGIRDLMGVRPDVMVPRVPDLYRPDAFKLYAEHGFGALGVCCIREPAWFTDGILECFTCRRIAVAASHGHAGDGRLLRRVLSRGADVILVLDLSGLVTAGKLLETLERAVIPWLPPEGAPSPLATPRAPSMDVRSFAADGIDWSPFPDPFLRQVIAATAGSLRKKRKKNDEYRELLTGFSLSARREAPEDHPPDATRRGARLVAQMLGDVALAGDGFDVQLAGGRFTGLRKAGREYLPSRPARSYLRVAGRLLHFRTRNSFSFEGDEGTGLREILAIDSREDASLSIEYSFCEGCSMLEITADVRWPQLAAGSAVEEHAPLVIALRELARGEEAQVESSAPDGKAIHVPVTGSSWVVVPGAVHRVALGSGITLSLRPGPEGSLRWNLVSFRVAKDGRRRFLEANPFGGWFSLPASVLSGRREKFSLLIGLEEDEVGKPGRI
ncbi:MAG: hypothetical protein ABSG17_12640 [Spirochaetia bacterium]